MTPLQWALMCILFTTYLLFGGGVFMFFEQHREIQQKEEISVLRRDVKEILLLLDKDFYSNDTNPEVLNALRQAKEGVIHRISDVCEAGNLLRDEEAPPTPAEVESDKIKWNYYNSVFFAFTVVTTIGYGHLSPSTIWGKIFVMIYALIGIPINTILLSGLGDYFSSRLVKVHKKSKEKEKEKNRSTKVTFIAEILFYLVPGLVIFILIPSGAFVLIEGWSFLDAIYFSFVSLTTIGFGDYVAGMGDGHNAWMWVYKASIIIWITFGLGYLLMILGFIAKGMTSKRVRVVIERRLNTIRSTKEKLSKDIDYMRRVVNELYLMKIKPVYEVEEWEKNGTGEEDFKAKRKRTQSTPCVSFAGQRRLSTSLTNLPRQVSPIIRSREGRPGRKTSCGSLQGQSTLFANSPSSLRRRCSDTDLQNIDREKTFESAMTNGVTADELLVTVVNALSGNVMLDVMEAVDELNHCEDEAGSVLEEHDRSRKVSKESNCSIVDYGHGEGLHWDLGAVSESDEEVLIEEDEESGEHTENDKLQQVIVHEVPKEASIMDQVTGVIRKISSGSRFPTPTTSSDSPSTGRISRDDHPRRRRVSGNTLHKESIERKISHGSYYGYHPHSHLKNPLAHLNTPSPKERKISGLSQQRKVSEESTKSRLTIDEFMSQAQSSRKVTPSSVSTTSRLSLETTSLAEFLRALDNVHARLNSKTSVGGRSDEWGASSSEGVPRGSPSSTFGSPITPFTPIRKSQRESSRRPCSDRRRKTGVFQPDFSYFNPSFVLDETAQAKMENQEKKTSK